MKDRPRFLKEDQAHATRSPWWPSAAIATWIIGSAPFLSVWVLTPLRKHLGDGDFALVLAALALAVAVIVATVGIARIKSDRWPRLAMIGSGLAVAVGYALLSERGSLQEAVVEQLHFVSYGALAASLIPVCACLGRLAPVGSLVGVVVVSVLDEGLQWLVPVRTGEVFDIALNILAGLGGALVGLGLFSIGLGAGKGARPGVEVRFGFAPERSIIAYRSWPPHPSALRRLGAASSLSVLLLAGFVDVVHLGHQIEDEEVGVFRSFWDARALVARNQRAEEAWRRETPGPLTPFEREDWFRTEAGWHVIARNRAAVSEDWRTAHAENRILEVYYPAFLDLRDSAGNTHRYPPKPEGPHRAQGQRSGVCASNSSGCARGRVHQPQ